MSADARAILQSFDAAVARGERCALATVVAVEGSAYRKPGARMLVCEGGSSTGSISAGCLERDVVEHARRVLEADAPKLVSFDTRSTSDETAWGLGLGCNGIVRVLVEPVGEGSLHIEALRSVLRPDAAGVCMMTLLSGTPGGRVVLDEKGDVRHERLTLDAARELARRFRHSHGRIPDAFVENLLPPMPLVIFGAGPDVSPVLELAHGLGWDTEIVDPQARPASRARFPLASRVTLARPDEVSGSVKITPRTFALLMSHDFAHDRVLLRFLLGSPAAYIGVMGPRARTDRMLAELGTAGDARLHAPVGLDIGADGPLEIALSIVAEMRAVLDGRAGGMLTTRRALWTHVPSTVIDDRGSQAHAGLSL